MNRKGNLLNGALLGTSGKSSRVYLAAQQWCEARITSMLFAGRQLSNTVDIPGVSSNFAIGAGRKLFSLVQASVTTAAKLFGLFAIRITPEPQEITVQASAELKCMHPVVITPIGQTLEAQSTAILTNLHPVPLASEAVCNLEGQSTITRMGMLKSSVLFEANFLVVLTEASRVRAPTTRIAYFPITSRTSTIRVI